MRSKEFIKEAGRNGSMDDFGQPINQPPTDAEYAARQAQGAKTGAAIKDFFSGTPKELKPAPANFPTIDPIARSNAGYLPATPQEIAAFQAANPYYGKVIGLDGLPINGGKVLAGGEQDVLQAAQAAAAGKGNPSQSAAAPEYADRFKPGRSATPGAATDDSAARAAADAERNRKAITTTERPAPAVKPGEPAPAPAVKPGEPAPAPAPAQNADPVPSLRVPGAAQAGQGGYNYTTGVAQDRPHRPDAGADQTTRNDYPFEPYTGPEPKPDVKPVVKPNPNPTPVPRRKVPKSVVQVSPDKQNLATTKTTLTPDEIKAAQEALRDPTIGPRDKAYYTELLKNQPASPVTPAKPTGTSAYDGTQKFYKPTTGNNATPAAGSVVIKPGDTLSRIAAANGTTVPAIMALNPSITNADRISAGQTVKLRESSDLARIRHLAGLTRN